MNLIIGGEWVSVRLYSFMVAIVLYFSDNTFIYCGGSNLGNNTIITAAHCVWDSNTTQYINVYYKLENMNQFIYSQNVSKVLSFKIHPDFNPRTLTHDVALLKVQHLPEDLETISLPRKDWSLATLKNFTIIGYGIDSLDSKKLGTMHKASVHFVENNFYPIADIDDTMFLATGKNTKNDTIDACQGDSGSPLFYSMESTQNPQQEEKKYLLGITSWGFGCANPRYPGVYSNILNLVDWIVSSI